MRSDGAGTNRGLCALVTLTILLAGLPAGGTAAETADPEPVLYDANVTVNATAVDGYVRVAYEVSIEDAARPVEVPIEVQVPDEAYVSHLSIARNGTTHEAHVEGREEAKDTYEEARRSGQTAGLAEKKRTASVYTFSVHASPGEAVEATFAYESYLTASEGVYTVELPAPELPRNRTQSLAFDARIQHVGGLEQVEAEPNATVTREGDTAHVVRTLGAEAGPANDTTIRYTLTETPRHGSLSTHVEDGTGYFAHRFRADASADRLPLDLALVLDTSGSMGGQKIDQLRRAGAAVVDALNEQDRLALVPFDGHASPAWEGLEPLDPSTAGQAREQVQSLRADGSTHIEDALKAGLAPLDASSDDRAPVLAFLTDGKATKGTQDTEQLRSIARSANTADADVYTLAFGPQADWSLVHGLAQDGNGTAVRVAPGQGASADIQRFLSALTTPVLTDLEVAYEGNVTPVREPRSTLFAGSEMLVVGTFDPSLDELEAHVAARTQDQEHNWTVTEPVLDDENPHLERLVGYQRLQALEDRIEADGGNETLEEQAKQIALEHGFVTDHTSLVLTLPPSWTPNATGDDPNATTNASTTLDLGTDDARAVYEDDHVPAAAPDRTAGGGGGGAPATDATDPVADDGTDPATDPYPDEHGDEQAETPAPGLALALATLAGLAALVRRSG